MATGGPFVSPSLNREPSWQTSGTTNQSERQRERGGVSSAPKPNRNPNLPRYRDNVYTFGAGFANAAGTGVRGAPVDALDSVLLPTALDGPAPPPRPLIPNRPVTWVTAGLVGVVVLCLAVTIRMALRRGERGHDPARH